jgi:arsenate reductase
MLLRPWQGSGAQKTPGVYYLERRFSVVINLPLKSLDEVTLGARLREVGQADGADGRPPHVA